VQSDTLSYLVVFLNAETINIKKKYSLLIYELNLRMSMIYRRLQSHPREY